jgi:hypothetical protein
MNNIHRRVSTFSDFISLLSCCVFDTANAQNTKVQCSLFYREIYIYVCVYLC